MRLSHNMSTCCETCGQDHWAAVPPVVIKQMYDSIQALSAATETTKVYLWTRLDNNFAILESRLNHLSDRVRRKPTNKDTWRDEDDF